MYIFLEKKAKLFANSGDPDQTPRSAASGLGLHSLPIIFERYPEYIQWVNENNVSFEKRSGVHN